MIKAIVRWLLSGALDRVLATVDRQIDALADKERIKGEIIRDHYRSRADWMRSGGFWLMLLYAAPLGFWFTAVVVYSVFWCEGCAYPKDWHIAALPAPLDEWAAMMVVAIFGVISVSRFK